MTEKTAKSNAGTGWLCCAAIIALCVISCFAQNGTYTTKKVLGLLGAVGIIGMMLFRRQSTHQAPDESTVVCTAGLSAAGGFIDVLMPARQVRHRGILLQSDCLCGVHGHRAFLRQWQAVFPPHCSGARNSSRSGRFCCLLSAASCNILMRPVRPLLSLSAAATTTPARTSTPVSEHHSR